MSKDADAAVAGRQLEDGTGTQSVPEGRTAVPAVDTGDSSLVGTPVERNVGRWFELVETVLDAGTRREAEQVVCGRLAGADCYRLAWVGELTLTGDELVVRTSATREITRDHHDEMEQPTVATDGPPPWATALTEETFQVDTCERAGATPWGGDDCTNRRERAVAVPLADDGAVSGVLVVHLTRSRTLSSIERRALRSLGAALERTRAAIRTRELLTGDGVVELEVSVEPTDSPLVAAASEHGCALELAGHVATDDGWLLYVDVAGATTGAVAETLAEAWSVDDCRPLTDGTDGGRVEVTVTDGSLVGRATDTNTLLADLVVDGESCRMTLELPRSADTRTAVARLQEVFEGLEVVSCMERDGAATTPTATLGVLDGLSDRQREVLETLYRAGYFEWPRESSAAAVADSLGIVPSTLQGHLRKAEDHVLSTLLE